MEELARAVAAVTFNMRQVLAGLEQVKKDGNVSVGEATVVGQASVLPGLVLLADDVLALYLDVTPYAADIELVPTSGEPLNSERLLLEGHPAPLPVISFDPWIEKGATPLVIAGRLSGIRRLRLTGPLAA